MTHAADWRAGLGERVEAMRGQLAAIAARNGTRLVPSIVGRHLDEVQPEAVHWLWPGRVPLGTVTVLEGDPGLGKSTAMLDIAARLTHGHAMPDGAPAPGAAGVVLLTAEDSLSSTVRPRLEAAGADLSRVYAVEAIRVAGDDQDRAVVLPAHIEGIRAAVDEVGALVVIVDPLAAYLDGAINSWRDHDVRRALHPLARLADEMGVAIVVIRHLTKGAGPAIYRGGGSIGIAGAARSVLLAARDPDDESRRVLAVVKSNLAREAPSLTYQLEPALSGVARIIWGGESPHRADALVSAPADLDERSALDEALDWLGDRLADGLQPVRDVLRDARADGIAPRTLQRARARLGVRSTPAGFGGPRVLSLPDPQSPPDSASVRLHRHMAETGDFGGDCAPESASKAERRGLEEGA